MNNFISKILANLKTKAKETVGVSITQSGLLEVCMYDKTSHNIKNYANRTIEYNPQTREVTNKDEFKTQLLSIFQELDISSNCDVILSLPNVFFEITSVPLILDNYAIESVLLGNIEQSYIFKKNEPQIAWVELGQNERNGNKSIAYSAIQRPEAEAFAKLFESIGGNLICIKNSHHNLIDTIKHTNICKNEITTDAPWNIVLATNNSVALFSMTGGKLVEFVEEPIALRAFSSTEEIYTNLTELINETMQNYIANSILVISDSNEIDAELLSEKIEFHGQKHYLNQNKFASGQITETTLNVLPNYISQITLYALGSCFPKNADEKQMNLAIENIDSATNSTGITIEINGFQLEITKELSQAITIILALSIIIILGIIILAFNHTNKSMETKISDLDVQFNTITQELATLKKQNENQTEEKIFDMTSTQEEIEKQNQQEILYYNALSFNIPHSTWITHFYVDANGAVAIEGKTSSTNNVYMFFKGIKSTIENSDLTLTKLKYSTGFEDAILETKKLLYDFELSNSQYASVDLSALENAITQPQEAQPQIPIAPTQTTSIKTPDKKAPNLPPIEDLKTTNTKKEENNKTEKITQKDIEDLQKQREAKGAVKKDDGSIPELPELPNLDE